MMVKWNYPREKRDKDNRIIVNVGPTTIMVNSEHPTSVEMEATLKTLCRVISGVDYTNDWLDLAWGVVNLVHKYVEPELREFYPCGER